jgi:hypothetical protein
MYIFLNIFSDIEQTTANVCNITIMPGIWQSLPANFSIGTDNDLMEGLIN